MMSGVRVVDQDGVDLSSRWRSGGRLDAVREVVLHIVRR